MTYDIEDIKKRYGIVGHDARLGRALETVLVVAASDLAVLIEGESGTGKEVLPRIIHDHSARKTKNYLAINCGSIPEGTIDSELFGHEKGAFTDAVDEHAGYFEAANGGTLFLDEVGELPLSTQARLLRVLETGEIMRVGSNRAVKTDVRVVAATNVDMQRAIREGRFRADLYYRLSGVTVAIPPLRERGDDVLKLFRHFAILSARAYRRAEALRLTEEAERLITAYPWPGNIRQLRNLVEQLTVLHPDTLLVTPQMLAAAGISRDTRSLVGPVGDQSERQRLETSVAALQQMVYRLYLEMETMKQFVGYNDQTDGEQKAKKALAALPYTGGEPIPAPSTSPQKEEDEEALYEEAEVIDTPATSMAAESPAQTDEDLNLEHLEKATIEKALRKYRNRRGRAAEELGISERTLYRKIKQYDIDE